jgi:thioredoxin-related protein
MKHMKPVETMKKIESARSSVADRLISRTAIVANATLALVLGATLLTVAWPRVANAIGIRPQAAPPAYRAGDQIDVPADWYHASDRTLVLFARASCGACQQAHPFLQKLVASLKDRSMVVMASTLQERDDDLRYGRALGIDDPFNHVTPAGLRVRATPTLVLIDRGGRILGAWEGVGPPDRQIEIEKAITANLN